MDYGKPQSSWPWETINLYQEKFKPSVARSSNMSREIGNLGFYVQISDF